MNTIEKFKQQLLQKYGVEIRFSKNAAQDFKKINKGKRPDILLAIVRRAKNGPLFKPKGIAEPLRAPLHSFAKIKLKASNERIIYRPVQIENRVIMEIIAIGPRDKEKAYRLAAERLIRFLNEMENNG
jgi:mRNA interferase RelE/StbE